MVQVFLVLALEAVLGAVVDGSAVVGGHPKKRDIRYVQIQMGDDLPYEYIDVYPSGDDVDDTGTYLAISGGLRQVIDKRLYGTPRAAVQSATDDHITTGPGSSQHETSQGYPLTSSRHQHISTSSSNASSYDTTSPLHMSSGSTKLVTLWKIIPFLRMPTTHAPPTYAPIGRCGYFPPRTTSRRPTTLRTTKRRTRTTTTTLRSTTTAKTVKPGGCFVVRTTTTKPTPLPIDEFLAAWAFYRHRNNHGRRDFHYTPFYPGKERRGVDVQDIDLAFRDASDRTSRSRHKVDQATHTRTLLPAALKAKPVMQKSSFLVSSMGAPNRGIARIVSSMDTMDPRKQFERPQQQERNRKLALW